MQRISRGGTAAASASAMAGGRRWRLPAAAATALAAISLAVPTGTALATTARPPADPPLNITPSGVDTGGSRYIFFTGGNGSVWRKTIRRGTAVAGATPVGGRLASGPSAVRLGASQTVLVFGQGRDGALWETSCNRSLCGKWTWLGGRITSKPGVAAVNVNAYSIYARGRDGQVWALQHTRAGWGAWHSIGGRVLAGTAPSAAVRGGTYVLVTGTDHGLYMARDSGPSGRPAGHSVTGGTRFGPVGGRTTASPALVNTSVALIAFARGRDGKGYWARFLRTSPGWHPMGVGTLASGLGATATGNYTWTYGMGMNGQVYENPGSWAKYPPTFTGWGQRTP